MLRDLCQTGAGGAAAALSGDFVLRPRTGPVLSAGPLTEQLAAGLGRLCEAIAAARLEEVDNGYLVASAAQPDADGAGAWLLRVRDGRLAAAFEYAGREEALRAIPPVFQSRSAVQIVETAIWALARRDVAAVLSLLDDDFTYTDPVFGLNLTGAATAINQLLLIHDEIDGRILTGLELTDLGGGIVQATGRIADPRPPMDPSVDWSWKVLQSVVDGRIKWTTRYANQGE